MRKVLWILVLIINGCSFLPASSETIYPTPMPTPTLAVLTKPIGNAEMDAALEFFYHLKVHIVSSEFEHIAEEVRYPITIVVAGQPKSYTYVSEFSADFNQIFTNEVVQKIISTDESELVFTPEGVKIPVVNIWFDLICLDIACQDAKFLITEINN